MFDNNQDSLIRSLQSPAAYPHEADRFQLIETHISWVFLCGPYAYKIKKAINLGFLDFSTVEQEHLARREWLRKRKELGFIRECHGDMHLGNMAIVDGRLVIFDGIEFNPDLYWIDVMSEVAFLCMDLEDDRRGDFAIRFLNGYLELTGDYEGLRVLRYYLAYRAMVRAKVAGIRVRQAAEQDPQSSEALEFERYLQLALAYTQPQHPVLFITHGLSGSGKSTLSSPLSERLGAIRIRSDHERQRLFGAGRAKGEAAIIDQGVYSSDATHRTYARLAELAAAVLESGHSVIIDATFLKRQQRDIFNQLAHRLGAPMRILFFHADADVLRQRIRGRERAGRDISEADVNVLEHQLAGYAGLDGDEQSCTITIDTESVAGTPAILALVNDSLGHIAG